MRILVTGAAGLCGTHLIDQLIKADDISKVLGIDNFSRGYPCSEEYIVRKDWKPKFSLIKHRFQDLSVKDINNLDVNVVIHLAAYNSAKESMEAPEEYFVNNDHGTLQLLNKLLHTKNTPFLVFASTTEIYGKPKDEPVSESMSPNSLNIYAATKLAGESYCSAFHHWDNYSLVKVRFSKMYGENHNISGYSSVVSNFINKALRDDPLIVYGCGGLLRDFIYVEDVVNALLKIIRKQDKVCGSTINVASGKLITIQDLAKKVIDLTGSKSEIITLPRRRGDYDGFKIDISKAKKLLDWSPSTTLDEGLMSTISWHKKLRKNS